MDQAEAIVVALKRRLKARGVTYAQLAKELGLSEASVKRVFAAGTLTLDRVARILDVLGMTFQELARDMEPAGLADDLTAGQEELLASDPALLSVFYLALSGATVEDIVGTYEITRHEVVRHLVALDRAKLIELHPGDVVKPLVSRHVRWVPEGLLARTYAGPVRKAFFESSFDGPGELHRYVIGRLDEAGVAQLEKKVARLLAEYDGLDGRSETPRQAQRQSICMMVAYRPFTISAVSGLLTRRR